MVLEIANMKQTKEYLWINFSNRQIFVDLKKVFQSCLWHNSEQKWELSNVCFNKGAFHATFQVPFHEWSTYFIIFRLKPRGKFLETKCIFWLKRPKVHFVSKFIKIFYKWYGPVNFHEIFHSTETTQTSFLKEKLSTQTTQTSFLRKSTLCKLRKPHF